jgi:RHS repeat-associated protein
VAEIDYQGAAGRVDFNECYSYHAAGAVTQKTIRSYGTQVMEAAYTYDSEGRVSTLAFPYASGTPTTTLTYGYDSMGRPYTVSGGPTTVSAATYGPANQMLTLTSSAFSETRTYNANLQLTQIHASPTSGTGYNFSYNYSATQNNGKIQSMTDAISGETITYTYDSLVRLINASGTGDANGAWSQAFTYDGFGNLVAKAGSNAPNNITINVNPANNQLNSNNALFDSVGNLLQYGGNPTPPEQYYSYDIENRVTQVTANGATTIYAYDSRNQRVYSGPQTTGCPGTYGTLFLYGVDGKKLAALATNYSSGGCALTVTSAHINVWFAGRLLQAQDRLHSIGKYFPYGEDRTNPNPANPANGVEKFATYTRDAESGLDYAYQRYYASGLGRFLTADPYGRSASSSIPQTLNRYVYVTGDPTNSNDPTGQDAQCGPGQTWTGEGCEGGGGTTGGECDFGDTSCYGTPPPDTCQADQSGLGFASTDPNPTPCQPVNPPTTSPASPSQPECFAQLKERPVNDPGAAAVNAVHTFWWVQGDINGQAVQYILSAGPATGPRGIQYLDVWATQGSNNGSGDSSGSQTAWSSGLSSAICAQVDAMISAAKSFPNNTVQYHAVGFLGLGGPNSNSAAHLLGTLGGFNVPGPTFAYGWWSAIVFPSRFAYR